MSYLTTFRLTNLISQYVNSNGSDYLHYQIYINKNMVLYEDVSKWGNINDIRLFGLVKGDEIKLRVVALKNSFVKSWEIASRVEVLSYIESKFDKSLRSSVYHTSPVSIKTVVE